MKSQDLNEFFRLLGQAKKEKEEEFDNLLKEANVDIDSLVSSTFDGIKKAEKEEKELETAKEQFMSAIEVEKDKKEKQITELIKQTEPQVVELSDSADISQVANYKQEIKKATEETVTDHAISILDNLNEKEGKTLVEDNSPESKIEQLKKELGFLKQIVNSQGGGGETRLEFLDDVDRDTAKVDDKFLKYDATTEKWVGGTAGGIGTEGSINTSGIITASQFYGNGSGLTGVASTDNIRTNTNATFLQNVNVSGTVTATTYYGSGSGLTGVASTDNIRTNTNATFLKNINVVGTSTVTGGVIGDVTGDLTGNADTATALENARTIGGVSFDGTSNINLPGVNAAGNQNTSGTAANLSGTPSISVTNVTASGDVTVGGTLTYEDVTNVDSVGLITARSGIKVGTGITLSPDGDAYLTGVTTVTGNLVVGGYLDVTLSFNFLV